MSRVKATAAVIAELGYEPGGALSGLQQMQEYATHARGPSMREAYGLRLIDIRPGYVVCVAMPDMNSRNSMGGVHGGYVGMILDTVCGDAVHTLLDPRQTYVTVEMKVSFLRAPKIATNVRAIGRVVSKGRTLAFAEGKLYDSSEKLLATASATALLRNM